MFPPSPWYLKERVWKPLPSGCVNESACGWVCNESSFVLGIGVTEDEFRRAVISALSTLLLLIISISNSLGVFFKVNCTCICVSFFNSYRRYWKTSILMCKTVMCHKSTWEEKSGDVSQSQRRRGLILGMPACYLPPWGTWEYKVFSKSKRLGRRWMKSVDWELYCTGKCLPKEKECDGI